MHRGSRSVSTRDVHHRYRRGDADDPFHWLRFGRGTLDPHLHIAALQLKLGDVFFDQEFYKFFDLFLIHAFPVILYESGRGLDRKQVFRALGQNLAACFCYRDRVFNAHTNLAGEIHTRLHGDDHSGLQRLGLAIRYARGLVYFQA